MFSSITISDLRPAGSELFIDSENFLDELNDGELLSTVGGSSPLCVGAIIVTSALVLTYITGGPGSAAQTSAVGGPIGSAIAGTPGTPVSAVGTAIASGVGSAFLPVVAELVGAI